MRRAILFCALIISWSLSSFAQARPGYDIVIRNAQILDGSGKPAFKGDVAVSGDQIVKVGKIKQKGAREIDAAGAYLTPGFIDMHSHSDINVLVDTAAEGKIRQGVTTEIIGESDSVAPRCPKPDWKPTGLNAIVMPDWTDLKGYFDRIAKQKIAVNIGSYVAHGSVRECVIGGDDRPPTPEELQRMQQIVETEMKQGALGLSTGLVYTPNMYAKTNEIIALASVAGKHKGIYTSHMRNESDKILDALNEAIEIGRKGKLPVHILHLKLAYERSWDLAPQVIATFEKARKSGLEMSADQYPFIASSTSLSSRLPGWVHDGGNAKMLERLRDPETRKRLTAEMGAEHYPWERAIIAKLKEPANKPLEHKSIADAAKIRNQSTLDTVYDLLLEERGTVSMIYFSMKEGNVRKFMVQPWVSIGSDGSDLRPDGPLGEGSPHPRNYATFPRVIGYYVRDEKLMPIEMAVHKMTGLAARQLHIAGRGMVKKGYKADLDIFNLADIKENSTFDHPHAFAGGMRYVIVNGAVVLNDGQMTDARPGVAIRGRGAE